MTHNFKQGDVVNVFQMSVGEGLLFEGRATVIKPEDFGDDYYLIHFHDDSGNPEPHQYLRFVDPAGQGDADAYVAAFNASLANREDKP